MTRYVLKSSRIIFEEGEAPGSICIQNGLIDQIGHLASDWRDTDQMIDVGDQVIMPGMIDVHVHINEPGRTEWEGFATATRAAAFGGTTTLVDMPLNSTPVTTTRDHFQQKLEAAENQLAVNVAYHAGVIPNHAAHLDEVLSMGAVAGKAFMIDSGMDDFPFADRETLRECMHVLKRHEKPLLAHGELAIDLQLSPTPWNKFVDYLASRPQAMELAAIKMLIELCEETGCAVHLVHLSAAEGLPTLREARAKGLPITVETCPQYLLLSAEDVPDGATQYKCAPPIREQANNAILKQALLAGDIDLIATDHSPCDPILKNFEEGDFSSAWGGISSLQYLLPTVWTAMEPVGATPAMMANWLCRNPAEMVGLNQLGTIEIGKRADFVIWDPDGETEVSAALTQHRHKITPYDGMTLKGKVTQTILGGELIFGNGELKQHSAGRSLLNP